MSSRPDGPPTPRDWLAGEEFPWPPVLAAPDGEEVVACFTITRIDVGRTRNDAPFLKLQLADCYGTVEARMWDDVDAVLDALRPGVYIGVRGRIERYQEERQLRVEQLAPLRVELDDLVLFLPRSSRGAEHMDAELNALIASVRDTPLRTLLERMLSADTETGHAFRLAPAAKQNHHAYLGGLIEHTLSMARLCDLFASHYGAVLDRDLLITAALLHDVGKIREIGARAGFPYTDEGKLLGHIVLGMQMVADAARGIEGLTEQRLLLLQHLIASHQGRYEWQSPREPRTLEALALHYADDLDAKVSQVGALLNAVPGGWTAYDRSLSRDFLRHMPAEGALPPASAPRPRDSAPQRRPPRQRPPEKPSRAEPHADSPPETFDLFGDA